MNTTSQPPKPKPAFTTLRWLARVTGTLLVAFTLFMAVGSFIEGYHKNHGQGGYPFDVLTTITFVCWGIGLAGLIVAWWREGLGGMLSLMAMIAFLALVYINPSSNFVPILLVFLLPPLLYLAYWYHAKGPGAMSKSS